MILIDAAGHLASTDGPEELHAFAQTIGLRRSWYHDANSDHPHYDCTAAWRRRNARQAGAVAVSTREMILRMRTAGHWR